MPAICLNMIVRNEMANLERCLSAIAPHVACWVIGDTGSTDGTQAFIQDFFAQRSIPGELHSFPFKTFEQARNEALDRARASVLQFDYLMFADADMELIVEDVEFSRGLRAPGYRVLQQSGDDLAYWNVRLARPDADMRYRGVTHEYVDVPGGTEALQGIWFQDHASGSNRPNKFARDIRLLTDALRRDPGNQRYQFYLAQSYRDAGRTREAAEAYARRADMGGWEEEAWNARLQHARCLRTLGNEGGFLQQALAAYQQRPQRAEPLYDLARYYRERGEHDLSILFSQAALNMTMPADDILFLENHVYSVGAKEEFSISAFYARDGRLREQGRTVCDALALSRDISESSRALARSNLAFYIEPAHAVFPSFTRQSIPFQPPDGYRAMNPSVAAMGDDILLIQRTVNFMLTEAGEYVTTEGGPVRTRNFLLRLDANLNVLESGEILPPLDWPTPLFPLVQGFEDARLIIRPDGLWCSCTVRELSVEGWCQQVLARIEAGANDTYRLIDWRVMGAETPERHEKNWMPQVDGQNLHFLYASDPTRIVDEQGTLVDERVSAFAAEHFRGGSQLVPFQDGWLGLIHEVQMKGTARHYQHRFVWLDRDNALRRVGRQFYFHQDGVEYAVGLAWHPDGKRLLVSYGVGDCEAWLAVIAVHEIAHLLTF